MAKRRGPAFISRKHMARAERERLITRYLLIGTGIVLLIVFGLVGYGSLSSTLIIPRQPVAFVNEVPILTGDFQTRVKYQRQLLLNQFVSIFNQASQFAGEPNLIGFFIDQLNQIELQLDNTAFLGQETLNTLIDEEIIRQEATKMGISVSDEELERAIEEAFGFFENGTPVPTPSPIALPTSTLSPQQLALVSPTPSPTTASTSTPDTEATATPAEPDEDAQPTPTLAPTLVPTEYTRELYETTRRDVTNNFSQEIGFDDEDLQAFIAIQELQSKLFEVITADVPREEEQVWARHILVEDEEAAREVLDRLDQGDDWTELAAEFSTDESNKNRGGDLSWFGAGRMVAPFEAAAFALDIGEISDPVETDFGWHIIQVLGHETRSLTAADYQSRQAQEYDRWLAEVRTSAEIEILDIWTDRVPTDPTIPSGYRAAIQQLAQPQVISTPVAPDVIDPNTDPEAP